MARSGALHVGLFLLTGLAALGTARSAVAGSTAMRCNAHGCVHIHCNSTGDRCYRYSDGYGAPPILDRYSGRGPAGYLHLVCDSDGDRCYPSGRRHWDFRDYYRRLGYRWNDEAY
ncbi:MAG TPA: hypothetical protein VHY79_10330 [Rhizomicrobium sp.]|jgi:hypothetical protein|nr:hypothetical protein [Rhizomicrobium sp.]